MNGARVLMTTDVVGGVWTYTIDLATSLAQAGVAVKIVSLGPKPGPGERAQATRRGLDLVASDHTLEWLAADANEVREAGAAVASLARAWGADLVHLNTPALAATARFDCPVVAVNHSCVATWSMAMGADASDDRAWQTLLTGEGLRRADLVLVPTAAHGAAVAAVHQLTVRPRTVHNGRAAPTMLGAHAHDDGRDEVFTTGRLWDAAKNILALDRAAARLAWPVRVAGATQGPSGQRIAFEAVESVGHLSGAEVRRHLAGRPIFVAPARFEPFGLGVLEAAQAGCALVLNDIATFRELWDGAALFVDADDPLALEAAIRLLMADKPQRIARGHSARTRSARYTVEAMARGTMQAYETCLCTAAPRAVATA